MKQYQVDISGSPSWIRRGGPLLAAVGQFDPNLLFNMFLSFRKNSNCSTIAKRWSPSSYPRRGARIVPVVNIQI